MIITRLVVVGFTVLWFFLWGYYSDWDINYMIWRHTYTTDGYRGMIARLVVALVLLIASMIVIIMPNEERRRP